MTTVLGYQITEFFLAALLRRRAASVASGWLLLVIASNQNAVTKKQPPHAFGISPLRRASPALSGEGSFNLYTF